MSNELTDERIKDILLRGALPSEPEILQLAQEVANSRAVLPLLREQLKKANDTIAKITLFLVS